MTVIIMYNKKKLTLLLNVTMATVLSTGSMTTRHLGSVLQFNFRTHIDIGITIPSLSWAST
jgi:hypothetical protein